MRLKDLENNISVERVKTSREVEGKTLTMIGSNYFGDKTTIVVQDHVRNKAYRFIDDRVCVAEIVYAENELTYIYRMMPVNVMWKDVISLSDDMPDAEYSFYTNYILPLLEEWTNKFYDTFLQAEIHLELPTINTLKNEYVFTDMNDDLKKAVADVLESYGIGDQVGSLGVQIKTGDIYSEKLTEIL
tara:strand:- start:920 stop:1480 length:561 start_codon:yes stop_codon:yes gene_type:complete